MYVYILYINITTILTKLLSTCCLRRELPIRHQIVLQDTPFFLFDAPLVPGSSIPLLYEIQYRSFLQRFKAE